MRDDQRNKKIENESEMIKGIKKENSKIKVKQK